MSPSGWIAIPKKKAIENKCEQKMVNCDYEFVTNLKNIIPLNDKETRVPYKIMSFDIEASSSHGDFPIPVKNYKKLATNIIDYFTTKYFDLDNLGFFSVEFLSGMIELFIKCEKQTEGAFMFKGLLNLVKEFSEGKKDFYQIVSYSKRV
jgi:hypothetical protein